VTQTETRIFHYDLLGHIIAETNQSGQMLAEYIYLGDQLLAMIKPGETAYYYYSDHLETPQVLTDGAGSFAWKAVYTPFGEAVISIGNVENPFRFPGQYYDQETGLHYNYFRYYNPQTGRYITPDPIGLEGGINLFVYVAGNPVRWIDRWGLIWEYHISTGAVWHFPPGGGAAELIDFGYSGRGDGLNNPLYQLEENVGPILEGDCSIGPLQTNVTKEGIELPFSMRLRPNPGTQTFGRGGFIIHGGTTSKGCPIFDEPTRKKIGNSGDKTWRVVR
jgi:RHS repeat-associated protein